MRSACTGSAAFLAVRWRDELLSAGKRAVNGGAMHKEQAKAIECLQGELAERNQVIGEVTVANRLS